MKFYVRNFFSSVELTIEIDKPEAVELAKALEKQLRAEVYRIAADLEEQLPKLYFNQIAVNPSFSLGGKITGTILVHYPLSESDEKSNQMRSLTKMIEKLAKQHCK